MVDIRYSQNFYTNKRHLQEMIRRALFSPDDIVMDIGSGSGIITEELSRYSKNVIAFELDADYFKELNKNISNSRVQLNNEDFLDAKLPEKDFKIFSNIPFTSTADIIKKITAANSHLKEAYLFVQEEAAGRYIGYPANTQISAILNSRYTITIIENLDSRDFKPMPSVNIVLLKIARKDNPEKEFEKYRDFVTHVFNQTNRSVLDTFKKIFTEKQMQYIKRYLRERGYSKPSDIPSEYYIEIFQYFKMNGQKYTKRVRGSHQKYKQLHSKREKVHRTRI